MKIDIHKVAGLIIQDRKVLASRSKNKTIFIQPGGKPEPNETLVEALIRELREEQGITITEQDVTFLGTYYAIAAGHEAEQLQMQLDAYIVNSYQGVLTPQSEIEENRWINSKDVATIELGSVFEHDIIPKLCELNLID